MEPERKSFGTPEWRKVHAGDVPFTWLAVQLDMHVR